MTGWELVAVFIAFGGFLISGLLALLVLVPRKYEAARYEQFDPVVSRAGYEHHWRNPDPSIAYITRHRIAAADLHIAKNARDVNQKKAKLLVAATVFAFGGVAPLGATLLVALV